MNKGDSDLYSRMDQINDLLVEHKPSIMILNELNSPREDQDDKTDL